MSEGGWVGRAEDSKSSSCFQDSSSKRIVWVSSDVDCITECERSMMRSSFAKQCKLEAGEAKHESKSCVLNRANRGKVRFFTDEVLNCSVGDP